VGATSTLSRRASEFAGIALFAASLIWLIALATYEPTDPVWFITAGATHTPAISLSADPAAAVMGFRVSLP
jgi:hypothetical protein